MFGRRDEIVIYLECKARLLVVIQIKIIGGVRINGGNEISRDPSRNRFRFHISPADFGGLCVIEPVKVESNRYSFIGITLTVY